MPHKREDGQERTVPDKQLCGAHSTVPDQLDFPAINEAFRGQAYCWVWGWAASNYSNIFLVKKNLCTGRSLSRKYYEVTVNKPLMLS
jgi:hypothetical protein